MLCFNIFYKTPTAQRKPRFIQDSLSPYARFMQQTEAPRWKRELNVPGGEEMVQVKVFDEWLNSGSLLDLLLAHNLSNSSRSSFNTSDQSVAELSGLYEEISSMPKNSEINLVSFIVGLDNDSLLASKSALEDDDDSTVLDAKNMRIHAQKKKGTIFPLIKF